MFKMFMAKLMLCSNSCWLHLGMESVMSDSSLIESNTRQRINMPFKIRIMLKQKMIIER